MEISLKKFYHLFWNNKACRNIFLLHKEILLEKNTVDIKITDYYLPRIVISNSPKQKKSDLKISKRSENIFIELWHKLSASEKRYLSEDKFKKYIDKRYGESKAIFLKEHEEFGLIGLIIEALEVLDNEEEFIKFLKKYKLIPDEINDSQTFAKYAEEEFIREITKFLKNEEVADLLESIDDISDIYNSTIKKGLIKANKHVTDKLFQEEDFSSRIELFENLYEIGVLTGGYFKSYLECVNCLPKTFSGYFNVNITPSKLKFKCPNCNKEPYFMVPYQIDRELFNHIIHPDGLLAFSISFLLNQYGIRHKRSVNLENQNEVDFVIGGSQRVNTIIEIKMFRNDKSSDALVKNLQEAISQMKKTKKKLVEKNSVYNETEIIIIANILDDSIYQTAREKCASDIKNYRIFIMSPDEFFHTL